MAEVNERYAKVESGIGLSFRDKGLLEQALTHSSYLNEHPEEPGGSNERLEFLGDAFIDLVVAQALYRSYPELAEGPLTQMRSAVVRDETLAGVARRLGLGGHLLLGRGEEASGGWDRESNLAGVMEALVGAVLLDRGYRVARAWVVRILRPELRRSTKRGVLKEAKSLLQELAHQQGMESPVYEVVGAKGPEHQRRFTVQVMVGGRAMGRGTGRRKTEAERAAAEEALRAFP